MKGESVVPSLPESQINKVLYEGLKSEMGSPTLPQGNMNRAIYDALNMAMNSPSRGMEDNITKNIYSQINESRNVNLSLPQNQIIQEQMYRALSKNLPSQKSRSSRRRTNFVTSDGYFPNYDDELKNLESSLSASR